MVIIFTSGDIDRKIALLDNYFTAPVYVSLSSNWPQHYLYPILAAIFYIFALPWSSHWIDIYQNYIKTKMAEFRKKKVYTWEEIAHIEEANLYEIKSSTERFNFLQKNYDSLMSKFSALKQDKERLDYEEKKQFMEQFENESDIRKIITAIGERKDLLGQFDVHEMQKSLPFIDEKTFEKYIEQLLSSGLLHNNYTMGKPVLGFTAEGDLIFHNNRKYG